FQRFELTKEEPSFAVGILPVLKQAAGDACNSLVAAATPHIYLPANVVDEAIFLDTLACPVGIQAHLLPGLAAGTWDGNEIGTRPAPLDDLVGDAVVRKAKVASRFAKGRIEDGILNNNARHTWSCLRAWW